MAAAAVVHPGVVHVRVVHVRVVHGEINGCWRRGVASDALVDVDGVGVVEFEGPGYSCREDGGR